MNSLSPLELAVVGHTNTGKTSLIRTLTHDESFGEVSDHPGVTRNVSGRALLIDGRPAIELYDTPGLEDSIKLLETIEDMRGDRRLDGPALLEEFLRSEPAAGRFAQEAKALRQVLRSDAALYVVDVRDAVHAKHRDELQVLAWCGRPTVPVLNFTASPAARTDEWRDALGRVGLHAAANFDTVVLTVDSECALFEKMRTLLDRRRATLDALIEDRAKRRNRLLDASAREIAECVVDVAALVLHASAGEEEDVSADLKQRVRERERRCARRLMELHRFSPDELRAGDMPSIEGRWGMDLFNPEAQKQWGVRAGGGAAAGALAGLTVDVALHGASMGLGAAFGAAIGAMGGPLTGKRLINRMRGLRELRVDEGVIRLLCARQTQLVRALLIRGHAAQAPVELDASQAEALQSRLVDAARSARVAAAHPNWSTIASSVAGVPAADPARDSCARRIAAELRPLLTDEPLKGADSARN